jgi:ATP-dependent helicase/nuclease subunit A
VKDILRREKSRLADTIPEACGFLAARADADALAALLGHLAATLRERKRTDAVITFADMIDETRSLLAREPPVRRRYAERFRAVLVDEFQDTDATQAEVVRLLADAPAPPVVFIVGDEKQSIYRFRGADVKVFHEVRDALGRTLPLGTNFRSQPAVLAFVNALAEAIFRPPPDADPAHWTRWDASQRLVAQRSQESDGPGVRVVSFAAEHARRRAEHKDLRAAEARELEARVLAGVVARLHAEEGVPWGHVAVLFRALTQVKAYEYALRRLEIPHYVVKGRGFFQCQEVGDVLALCATLLDPRDEVALATLLRSPFFAVDDDTLWRLAWPPEAERPGLARRFRRGATFADLGEQGPALEAIRDLLLRLRRLRHRATIAEMLEEAFAATDFEAVCLTQFQGAQKVANVRKLIELGRDLERRRHAGLREFVGTVRALAEREPREPEATLAGEEDDVVRLMTIHQAKGLEFPVVLVPDLGRLPTPNYATTVLDDRLGLVTVPTDEAGRAVLGNLALERHRRLEQDRERAEQARLFYVACTRARDLLVLLEGRGDPRYLEDGAGDRFRWCHQVWDLLGRDAVRAFAAEGEAAAEVVLPGGGAVRLERAETYLAARAAPAAPLEPHAAPAGAAEREVVARVLDFVPPAPAEVEASPTALADFRRCPRRYWFRHALGVAEPGSGGVRATLLGTAAHGVLEGLDLAATPEVEVARRLAARLECVTLPARERAALAADLVAAATALQADVAAGLVIVGREVPFVLALPAGRPRVVLHGRLDLLARRGRAHVVRDYKYALPTPGSEARHAAQLGAYQLAVRAAGAAVVEAELVFLRGGPRVRPLPPLDPEAETAALVAAGTALGVASARGAVEAFPKAPPEPAACVRLGCGYVGRCWPESSTRRARDRRSDSAAS